MLVCAHAHALWSCSSSCPPGEDDCIYISLDPSSPSWQQYCFKIGHKPVECLDAEVTTPAPGLYGRSGEGAGEGAEEDAGKGAGEGGEEGEEEGAGEGEPGLFAKKHMGKAL